MIIDSKTAMMIACLASFGWTPAVAEQNDEFSMLKEAALVAAESAEAHNYAWRDTRAIIARAEAAWRAGERERARILIASAKRQAMLAVNQALLEDAHYRLREYLSAGRVSEPNKLAQLRAYISKHDGESALRLAKTLDSN